MATIAPLAPGLGILTANVHQQALAEHAHYSTLTTAEKIEFLFYKIFAEESRNPRISEKTVREIENRLRETVTCLPSEDLPSKEEIDHLIHKLLTDLRASIGRDPSIRERNIESLRKYTMGYTSLVEQEEFTEDSLRKLVTLYRTYLFEIISSDPSALALDIELQMIDREWREILPFIDEHRSLIGTSKEERQLTISLLQAASCGEFIDKRSIEVNYYTRPGEALYVIGEEQDWDPSRAIRLDPIEEGKWSITSDVPKEGSEYKFLIGPWIEKDWCVDGGALRWENGTNRLGDTSSRPLYF